MLRISFAAVPEADVAVEATPLEPRYCVLTESFVRVRWIYVHRVASNGRLREAVLAGSGERLRVPVDTSERAFHEIVQSEMANDVGHFAFVARDRHGRYRGRRDFWVYRNEAERAQVVGARRPTPAEKQETALTAALQRVEAAEQALPVEQDQRRDAEAALKAERRQRELLAQRLDEALAAVEDAQRRADAMACALAEAEDALKAWHAVEDEVEGDLADPDDDEERGDEGSGAPGTRLDEYADVLESLLGKLGALIQGNQGGETG